jgi:hypothetical protein
MTGTDTGTDTVRDTGKDSESDLNLNIQVTTAASEDGPYFGTTTVATCKTDNTCNEEASC